MYNNISIYSLTDSIEDITLGRDADGNWLIITCAAGREDQKINVWDLLTGEKQKEFRDKKNHVGSEAIATDPSGRYLAFHYEKMGLIDLHEGTINYLTTDSVCSAKEFRFLNENELLFADSHDYWYIYDIAKKEQMKELTFNCGRRVKEFFLLEDRKTVITGHHDDNRFRVWKIPKEEKEYCKLRKVLSHTQEVKEVAYLPDQKLLVSVSEDFSAKVWNVENILAEMEAHKKKKEKKEDEDEEEDEEESDGDVDSGDSEGEEESYIKKKPYLRRVVNRHKVFDNNKKAAFINNKSNKIAIYDLTTGKHIKTQEYEGRYKHGIDGLETSYDQKWLIGVGSMDLFKIDTQTLELSDTVLEMNFRCCGVMTTPYHKQFSLILSGDRYVFFHLLSFRSSSFFLFMI